MDSLKKCDAITIDVSETLWLSENRKEISRASYYLKPNFLQTVWVKIFIKTYSHMNMVKWHI